MEPDRVTLCEIYKCDECPRMGDDCDGRWEEENENNRRTGLISQDRRSPRQIRCEQHGFSGTRYQSWAGQGINRNSAFANGRAETLKAIIGWTVVGLSYAAFGFYFVLAIAMS